MISSDDIQRLIHRPPSDNPVLSVFLDMSVNAENKRTFRIFLNQRRGQYVELDSDRSAHHREPLGAAFERVERWIDDWFDEANKGVAVYAEIGGDWLEGLQFPVPVRNRTVIAEAPIVGPLAQLVDTFHHHGVILVDREHLRMLSVYLGTPLHEHEVRTEPYPTPHDVQRGGYSAVDFQKRKAEEMRHFFKEFALEVAEFDRRYRPDDLILLGTTENVKKFREFLSLPLREKVVHTDHIPMDATSAQVLERLGPFFVEQARREEAEALDRLRQQVQHHHMATAGLRDTLEQLQEGKVDRLVLARDLERKGSRCTRCGFYLAEPAGDCPYCGGATVDNVDLVEAMIRMAKEQDIRIEFVEPEGLTDLNGVGALLRF